MISATRLGDFLTYGFMTFGLLLISDYYTFSKSTAVADAETRARVEKIYEDLEREKAIQMELGEYRDEIESEARAHQLAIRDWDERLVLARFRSTEDLLYPKSRMLF